MKKRIGRPPRTAITDADYIVTDCGYETPCWIAKTKKSNGRYPLVRMNIREVYMHRAMYEQEVGPIPSGSQIDHLCRNTYCVNPSHLEAVTPAENTRRSRSAKLDVAAVAVIRSSDDAPHRLAARFDVSESLIYQVRKGMIWKDV